MYKIDAAIPLILGKLCEGLGHNRCGKYGIEAFDMTRIQELVNIEQNVRNVAAHNIVSVTPEWIKERTGKSVDDIFWILKYVCEQVKINTRKENWNSYDSMNKRIIDELDKD